MSRKTKTGLAIVLVFILCCIIIGAFYYAQLNLKEQNHKADLFALVPRDAQAIIETGNINTLFHALEAAPYQNELEQLHLSDLFTFLNKAYTSGDAINGSAYTTATGVGLQAALAEAWGQLQVKFEDDTAEAVYFVNPLDVADYLASANITVQTAFGMNYVEDFLGLGTVIMSSRITQGTFVATAKENIILYYLTMNGDVARAFDLTADETGFIGINSGYQNNERAQIESLIMSGIQYLVEYAEGVVKGTITSGE